VFATRNMATQKEEDIPEELIATQPYEEDMETEEKPKEETETKDENKYGLRKNGKPKHKPGRKQKSRYYNY
jgi:hypothetical protein